MASPRLPESHPEEPSVQLVNEGPHGAVTFLGGMRGAARCTERQVGLVLDVLGIMEDCVEDLDHIRTVVMLDSS